MERPTTTPHLRYLDGVRGLAAVYVLLHHAALNMPARLGASLAVRLVNKATGLGHYAVDVFIVLSGYCLMLPVVNGRKTLSIDRFVKSRFVRIVPPYWAAMVLSLVLIQLVIGRRTGTHWDVSLPVTGRDVLLHTFLIHDWMRSSAAKINHTYWSVAVEWQIYFLFPLILALWRRIGALRTVLATTVVSYGVWAALWFLDVGNPSPWGSSVYYVALFTFGMLSAQIAEWLVAAKGGAAGVALARPLRLAVLVVGAAVLGFSAGVVHVPLQLRSVVVGAWAALFLVSCRVSFGSSAAVKLLSGGAAVWFGKRAYSLYLVHAPILQLVYQYVLAPRSLSPTALTVTTMIVSVPICIAVANAFFWAVEKPFHRLSRRVT
ncbi:MAG: acyltransferase family protein [Polyangia bacterium]